MIDGRLPISPRDRSPLGIRNRHDRQLLILTKHRLQFWEVKPTMERGHRGGRIPPGKRKTQEIQMRVNDVEVAEVSQSLLHIHHHSRIAVEHPLIETERATAYR